MQRSVFRSAVVLASAALIVAGSSTAPGQKPDAIEKVMQALPDKAPAQPKAKHKILIFSKTAGFRHGSIAIGAKAIAMMGDKTGAYTAFHTEDESFFEPEKLKAFDAVFMLNTTGDCLRPSPVYLDAKGQPIAGAKEVKVDQQAVAVDDKGKPIPGAKVDKVGGKEVAVDSAGKTIPKAKITRTGGRTAIVDAKGQEVPGAKRAPVDSSREERLKKSLADFVSSGKGLIGVHSATDTYHGWKDYNQMMGGTFAGHPWHTKVPIKNLAPGNPINAAFDGKDFEVTDEIYQFRADTALPTDRKFLLALDTTKMDVSKGSRKDGLYPVSWISTFGKGRTFYCSLGHRDEIYWNPVVLKHYLAGIQYALGDLAADATPTASKK
jgi:type 1 glutamine amidotransferase